MRKILWASDSTLLPTGYANVTRRVCNGISQFFEVHALGFQTNGNWELGGIPFNLPGLNFTNYGSINPERGLHRLDYGKPILDALVNKIKPDCVTYLCDMFMCNWIDEFVQKKWRKHPLFFMYAPFDSDIMYADAEKVLKVADFIGTISKFGQKVIKKELGLDSYYLPHGVDCNTFYPLSEEEKREIRKRNNLEGKFVIGMVGRNTTRKMLTRLIKAFRIFAKDKDDAYLLLHCANDDPSGYNITDFIDRNHWKELKNKVKFTHPEGKAVNYTEQQLNSIYNAFDIHVLSTTGEGWGIPICEAMACGIPNVLPNFTTPFEILNGGRCGELVKIKDMITGQLNTNRAMVDVEDMAEKFNKLYYNRKLIEKYSKNGLNFVRKNFRWEDIYPLFIQMYQDELETNVVFGDDEDVKSENSV